MSVILNTNFHIFVLCTLNQRDIFSMVLRLKGIIFQKYETELYIFAAIVFFIVHIPGKMSLTEYDAMVMVLLEWNCRMVDKY